MYDYLVKLGIIAKKRLIINIILLRESYEKREISEIRRINSRDNPGDVLTKRLLNQVLKKLVLTNRLVVRVEVFIDRTKE